MRSNESYGAKLIGIERKAQLEVHGITLKIDKDRNAAEQLRFAAIGLIGEDRFEDCPIGWDKTWWRKTCEKSYRERLVIAGALIAAEIDRTIDEEENEGG